MEMDTASDPKQDEIILKTNYVERGDIRRVRIKRTDFSIAQLRFLLHKLYKFGTQDDYLIKYQDDEGDMITISHDIELQEAFRWVASINEKNKRATLHPLHLVIILDPKTALTKQKSLIGITDLFLKQFQDLSVADNSDETKSVIEKEKQIDKEKEDMAIDFDDASEALTKHMSQLSLKNVGVLPRTEWHGTMTYPNETYPFMLAVSSVVKNKVEGTIMWPTLNSVTAWLGTLKNKGEKLVFTEYEALHGAENVEVPTNYSCTLCGNLLSGQIVTKDQEPAPTFALKFAGITSQEDGTVPLSLLLKDSNVSSLPSLQLSPKQLIELGFLPSLNSQQNALKRKYNLITNSAADATTIQDKWASFKKLTNSGATWYKKVSDVPFVSEPRPKAKSSEMRKSCSVCGQPVFQQLDKQGRKVLACPKFPNCYTPRACDEHYDSSEEEDWSWISQLFERT